MADPEQHPDDVEMQRVESQDPSPSKSEERDSGVQRSGTMTDMRQDSTIGGLLNEEGEDVRKKQEVTDEEDIRNKRRKGTWRGVELATQAGLQYDFVLNTFDYKIQAMILSSDMQKFVIFIIMFCFFFLISRDINSNFYYSKAMKDPLLGSQIAYMKVEKYFDDITEAAEWEQFVLQVFLYQSVDPGMYPTGGNNVFLGATRFRTQRVRKDTCTVNKAIIPASMPPQAQECYGEISTDNQDDGTTSNAYNSVGRWQYMSCADLPGGQATTGQVATYDCGGYIFTVPWWRNSTDPAASNVPPTPSLEYERMPKLISENMYVIPALFNNPPFVDNLATRFVIIEFFTFNPTLKTFLSAKMYIEIAAGGLWIPNVQFRVFEVWGSSDIGKLVYDIFFLIFVLYYVFDFFRDLVVFHRREKKILAFFFDIWNLLEMVNLVIFLIVFVFRFLWIAECNSANVEIEALAYTQEYPATLDTILIYYMFQVYLNSVNTVLSFLKILKFFRLNDRLNILTRTLSESQDSIIGVLFIFLLVVTAFAMTGHGLFGLGVWRFRSIDASFSTLLQMLLGQFDYEEMKNENRVLAGLFFWGYIILGLFCLLNFLIGVLMEAFAEVSSTRSILPLESVLAKTWEDLKKILSCTSIKAWCKNCLSCTSREELLQESLEMVREYRSEVYPADEEDVPDEEKQMIYRVMFLDAISPELTEKIGQDYLEYVWDDLVYEWDQSNGAQEAIDAQRNMEMTTKGVRAAIGKQLERIEQFSVRMVQLEKDLEKLAGLLEKS